MDRLGVYQPTTVSYERPSLLSHTSATASSTMKVLRRPMPQICVLILSLMCFAAGITMIVSGAADYADTESHKAELGMTPQTEVEEEIDIGLIVGGVFILLLAFALAALYVKVADWRRNCVCPCGSGVSKKQGLARQLQGGNSANGPGPVALNPSTDPLVSHTQYAPVSEIPMKIEYEERHTLMNSSGAAGGGADPAAEESERMLDTAGDSRIVLRPIGHVEDA